MTPSFIGLIATMLPGVRPSISGVASPPLRCGQNRFIDRDDRGPDDHDALPAGVRTYSRCPDRSRGRSENSENSERRLIRAATLSYDAISIPFLPRSLTRYIALVRRPDQAFDRCRGVRQRRDADRRGWRSISPSL